MTLITARLTGRGDTEANWTLANPILSAKEIAFSTDVFYGSTDQPKFKVGNGVDTWTALDYMPISSGGVAWGAITGTLSSQTDLQAALNAKQDALVSGTNIKTINGTSVLGSGNIATGTILGSVAATAGLIPFATGTLDTVTTSANFGFATATNVLFVNSGQIRAGNNLSGYAGTILASNSAGHNIAALNVLTTDSASLNFPSAADPLIYWGEIRKYGYGASGTFGSTGLGLGSSMVVKAGSAAANNVFLNAGRFTYALAAGVTFYGFTMPYTGGMRIGTEPFIGGASLTDIALHLDNGAAAATHLKFTNGTTTGTTVNDGSDIGITTTGILQIRQRENLGIEFYTNNTLQYTISAAGKHTLGVVNISSSGSIDGVISIISATLVLSTHFRPASSNDATTGSDVTLVFQGAPVKVLTNASLVSVAGIPASYAYATFWGENATGVDITIKHESASATAANRIITPTGADVVIKAGAMFCWTYSSTQSRNIIYGI